MGCVYGGGESGSSGHVLFRSVVLVIFFFFFNDTATTEIYTLSLHDALPIYAREPFPVHFAGVSSNFPSDKGFGFPPSG